jgi:hypothetical protein
MGQPLTRQGLTHRFSFPTFNLELLQLLPLTGYSIEALPKSLSAF